MTNQTQKPCIAIVSLFLDKRHGTERPVVGWLSSLPDDFDIHIYSQRLEDLDPFRFTWHRIPKLPGPHLFNFIWWLAANWLWRRWDRHFRGMRYDLVYSPGANCLDADVISVHIVFAEYGRRVKPQMSFLRHAFWTWPRLAHRKIYYGVVLAMERRAYTNRETILILIAKKGGDALGRFYGRHERFPVLYPGTDHAVFNPARRAALRPEARRAFKLPENQFTLVLVGNDWRNKGVPVLLDAIAQLSGLPIGLLVVTKEDAASCEKLARERGLGSRVQFLRPRKDVEFYYAAADAYAGPSLEDAGPLPPAEAMACGLPVIVSSTSGISEIIKNGVDGLILEDPTDSGSLAAMIRRLYEDTDFRDLLAANAVQTAMQYTLERNGREFTKIFEKCLREKRRNVVRGERSILT